MTALAYRPAPSSTAVNSTTGSSKNNHSASGTEAPESAASVTVQFTEGDREKFKRFYIGGEEGSQQIRIQRTNIGGTIWTRSEYLPFPVEATVVVDGPSRAGRDRRSLVIVYDSASVTRGDDGLITIVDETVYDGKVIAGQTTYM